MSFLIDTPQGPPRLPPKRTLPKWRLDRVISGHTGWIRAVATSPSTNLHLFTGSTDRLIKVWDLATSQLLLTLTGHVASVRGLAPSGRHPYLFSGGDDRQVKCWDLTTNQVVRHYHGHLHAVTQVRVHPELDLLVTCSRDSTAKLWDIRSKACIHTLCGHKDAIHDVAVSQVKPQIVTASADQTVRLWDIVSGTTRTTLTHHKKGVRAVEFSPADYTMGSAGETVKRWSLPDGRFLHNCDTGMSNSGDDTTCTIWNCLAINSDNIAVAGSDSGALSFMDWPSGSLINTITSPVQPGSMDCEAGILCCTFDATGSRLFTGDVDKTVKVYKEVFEE